MLWGVAFFGCATGLYSVFGTGRPVLLPRSLAFLRPVPSIGRDRLSGGPYGVLGQTHSIGYDAFELRYGSRDGGDGRRKSPLFFTLRLFL